MTKFRERLLRDKVAFAAALVVLAYVLVALFTSVGVFASSWNETIGNAFAAPSASSYKLFLGTDIFGRSVFLKVIQGAQTALFAGLICSIISMTLALILGSLAGYFGGLIDDIVVWFYSVLGSIPNIILLVAITYVLGRGLFAVYLALGLTTWIGLARLIRAEVMKQKSREYVTAARALGVSNFGILIRHIVPNVSHLLIVGVSINLLFAVKAEVVLSFLGLGAQDRPSWGVLIDDARLELLRGIWWPLAGASIAMFFLVLSLNILSDALRDCLDPRTK